MENLALSFNVVAPLMLYMLAGLLLRKTGVLRLQVFRDISRAVFYVPLPALCFQGVIDADFDNMFDNPFMLCLAGGIVLIFVLSMLVVPRFCPVRARRGVLVQSIFRSNDGVFGLAVAAALMGENMGLMTLAVALSVPLFNALSVISMEVFRGGKVSVTAILRKVFQNPIVVACVLAIVLNLCRVPVPGLISKTLDRFADVCAPMGFLALGGTLTLASVRQNARALGVVTLLRLVVIPAVFVTAAFLLGYRGDYLLIALIIFGAPTAMSTYTMACTMDGDEALASATVAVTSLLSIASMFLFIFLLKQLGVA